MSDHEFLTAFEACRLPAAEWTHSAHLRFAWLVLNEMPYSQALNRIRLGINRYNNAVLKKDMAYHETITVAYTRLIVHARNTLPASHRFEEFCSSCPALFDRLMPVLMIHYSRDVLFGTPARLSFVEPDLAPLPDVPPVHEYP